MANENMSSSDAFPLKPTGENKKHMEETRGEAILQDRPERLPDVPNPVKTRHNFCWKS